MKPTIEAKGSLSTLKIALQTRKMKMKLIHHYDRGVQYCSWDYVDLIQEAGIKMSMCSSTESNENSMAERLNRTLQFREWICVRRGSFEGNSIGN